MLPLSNDERRALLILARQAIVQSVLSESVPDSPSVTGRLAEPGIAFVTIYRGDRLRGCIGQTEGSNSLAETVVQCAVSAALHDSRFAAITKADLPGMAIEISVLSKIEPVSASEIEPGKCGVLVSRGERRALLLPQVAVEHHWGRERFLEEVCVKAGLPREAWRDPETNLFGFTAEVFSEEDVRSK